MNTLLKSIFDGNENIPEEMYEKTRDKISAGVGSGYGIAYDLKDVEMVFKLKNNAAVFSAFKANHYGAAMRSLLVDEKGNKRLWNDFRKEAQKIDPKYNQQWLEAEYNMAIRQARSAKQWQGFEKAKDMYPNLEYMASRSASPSEAHRKLWGTILPIEHPFWDTAMPPSRWNCKCWVKQSDAEPTTKQVEAPESLPGIAGNSGKSGQVFDASHAYINKLSKVEKKEVGQALNKMRDSNTEVISYQVGKNAIRIPVNADADDLVNNLVFAEAVVSKYKKDFHINGHSNQIGKKNPEFTYLKTTGDRVQWDKAYDARKFIQNGISDKLGKGKQLRNYDKSFVGFDFLGKLKQTDAIGILAKLKGSFKVNENLQFVILKNNKNTVVVKRFEDVKDFKTYLSKIEKELL